MDGATRNKYMKVLSEEDAQKLEALAKKIGKDVEECLHDILTLTVTTKYEGETTTAARTDLFFDGDIDIVLPKAGGKVDQETFDIHQKTVELAMKNRQELIRIFAELFDLKGIFKLI